MRAQFPEIVGAGSSDQSAARRAAVAKWRSQNPRLAKVEVLDALIMRGAPDATGN